MSTHSTRLLISGIVFLIIFVSGYWLTRAGRPYSVLLLTVHKLIALALFIYLGIGVYRLHQATPLGTLELVIAVLTALFFVATIVSGGLASTETPPAAAIVTLHHITPYLTLLGTAATLYLLFIQKA